MDFLIDNRFGIVSMLMLFGAFNSFVFAGTFFFGKRTNQFAHRLFAGIMLLFGLRLSEASLVVYGLIWKFPWLSGTTYPLLFALGPLFFIYIKRLLDPSYRPRARMLLSLLPMAAFYIHWSSWILSPLDRKSEILYNQPVWDYSSISMEDYVIMGVIFLHTLVYLAMAYRHIQRSQDAAADSSSDGRLMVHFRWLRVMSLFMLCYLGGFLTLYTLLVAFGEYGAVLDRGWLLVLSIFVQVIGYIGLQEPSFRLKESAEESSLPESRRPILLQRETVPYERSGLSRSQAMDLSARLDALMEVEKTFLKSDLKAWDVAQLLDVPVYHLSQALSQIHGCNFFEYVNRYRVVEARRLLVDEQFNHITILAIALEAGFNSKASFNRSFKKVTGSTPSSFRAALSTA